MRPVCWYRCGLLPLVLRVAPVGSAAPVDCAERFRPGEYGVPADYWSGNGFRSILTQD